MTLVLARTTEAPHADLKMDVSRAARCTVDAALMDLRSRLAAIEQVGVPASILFVAGQSAARTPTFHVVGGPTTAGSSHNHHAANDGYSAFNAYAQPRHDIVAPVDSSKRAEEDATTRRDAREALLGCRGATTDATGLINRLEKQPPVPRRTSFPGATTPAARSITKRATVAAHVPATKRAAEVAVAVAPLAAEARVENNGHHETTPPVDSPPTVASVLEAGPPPPAVPPVDVACVPSAGKEPPLTEAGQGAAHAHVYAPSMADVEYQRLLAAAGYLPHLPPLSSQSVPWATRGAMAGNEPRDGRQDLSVNGCDDEDASVVGWIKALGPAAAHKTFHTLSREEIARKALVDLTMREFQYVVAPPPQPELQLAQQGVAPTGGSLVDLGNGPSYVGGNFSRGGGVPLRTVIERHAVGEHNGRGAEKPAAAAALEPASPIAPSGDGAPQPRAVAPQAQPRLPAPTENQPQARPPRPTTLVISRPVHATFSHEQPEPLAGAPPVPQARVSPPRSGALVSVPCAGQPSPLRDSAHPAATRGTAQLAAPASLPAGPASMPPVIRSTQHRPDVGAVLRIAAAPAVADVATLWAIATQAFGGLSAGRRSGTHRSALARRYPNAMLPAQVAEETKRPWWTVQGVMGSVSELVARSGAAAASGALLPSMNTRRSRSAGSPGRGRGRRTLSAAQLHAVERSIRHSSAPRRILAPDIAQREKYQHAMTVAQSDIKAAMMQAAGIRSTAS